MKGIGWYRGNSDLKPHEVGTKQANPWGLHDMHGNVSEICKDMYSITLKGGKDPVSFGGLPVIRGGGWQYGDFYCRSASRLDMVYKDTGASDIGFRIVAAQVKQ